MSKEQHIRSIRISDEVFEELLRLRKPTLGLGEQRTWDSLFNYFLILHHGNGDWRRKVKYVDTEVIKQLNEAIEGMKDDDALNLKVLSKLYNEIEKKVYNKFLEIQRAENAKKTYPPREKTGDLEPISITLDEYKKN